MASAAYSIARPHYLTSVRYRVVKRGLDLLISSVALVAVAPLYPFMALAVKLTSPGAVFYRWSVVGVDGTPFVGYKIRTMVADADAIRATLNAHNERRGPAFKMKNDPRITTVGRFLRRLSIDETPQLLSILKGDMSLVGPRPLQVHEWSLCSDYQKQRNQVKPGAVSLWHVDGQPPTFDEWMELDMKYIANWSLRLDCSILVKAAGYVLRARNQ
jgi:lipopolysaccharide/colanic/teichoic acid biosynthesis glycosyltransferase